MSWRSEVFDRPRVQVLRDPAWLLAPLYVRDLLGLAVPAGPAQPGPLVPAVEHRPVPAGAPEDAAARWPGWWQAAVAHRPDVGAPRDRDLAAAAGLATLWELLAADVRGWLDARRAARSDPAAGVEQDLLQRWASATGRAPAPRTLTVQTVPVAGPLLVRADTDRWVVATGLRERPADYRHLLEPVLAELFG
ncbi:hypothetical protein [Nakamurella endophytica]|uniref:Uncharacterized protein n=1 Tax=Nakamurella endophytica TaxID=1748367 RepID=A0A917WEG1_9ACTN|nr:hypothetical protein [Nakamurella endophytica]GGL95578.1 hypothetical protein GCM10011594_14040 [Nakamurella endophytica]